MMRDDMIVWIMLNDTFNKHPSAAEVYDGGDCDDDDGDEDDEDESEKYPGAAEITKTNWRCVSD